VTPKLSSTNADSLVEKVGRENNQAGRGKGFCQIWHGGGKRDVLVSTQDLPLRQQREKGEQLGVYKKRSAKIGKEHGGWKDAAGGSSLPDERGKNGGKRP